MHFSFVNIDFMQIIGAKCIGDFNYYFSFTIMVCLPVTILVIGFVNYYASTRILEHKLATMTKEQKKKKKKEAMHALFELADSDHSGNIGPAELALILSHLNWSIKLKEAIALAESIGAHADEFGNLMLMEHQFITAMLNNEINRTLEKMNIQEKSSLFRQKSQKSNKKKDKDKKSKSSTEEEEQVNLSNSDELVKWTLQSGVVASCLSGATQLLLLAHTPVSRKVFQYFHCHDIGGQSFLRADYDIVCTSAAYYLYMPFVLVVLVGFTTLLPTVILFYLFRHRKNLYSTRVHQRIGWLYDPYVRGAEFWQVHDLLMKMLLTGVLIYVPTTLRAGIAILICLVAIANLNYFQPHKNVVLFWLTQISFVTTASKYVVALLLSASMDKSELTLVGTLLIGFDIFFMCSSLLAVLMSLRMLHAKISAINKTSTKVVPVEATKQEQKEDSESEKGLMQAWAT